MRFLVCILAALLPTSVWALGPHEVLLLINEQYPPSAKLGEWYATARGIPAQNIVRVSVPKGEVRDSTISQKQFTRLIWRPATDAVKQRGLDDQILAWVYSVGFPVCISSEPPTSILGLTFVRNRLPEKPVIESGSYQSPFFGGPLGPRGSIHRSQSLDTFVEWIGADRPLPAMMLGYMGSRNGNTLETIRACLQRGIDADSTFPTGTVYFVQTGDIRSLCRAWQQGRAVEDLRRLHVRAVITEAEPANATNVLGMQVGSPDVKPGRNHYVPGAMAEHLTSAGAIFGNDFQTKMTTWIDAGATATAGAVTEPYAIWSKFPNAHFYYYYASGCTMLESFYQSILSPLQVLLVGEPLCSPWKPRDRLHLTGLPEAALEQAVELRPLEESKSGFDYRRYKYYLDGREITQGPSWRLDPAELMAGTHTVRVVGYRTGLVRQQIFAEATVRVPAKFAKAPERD